MARKAAQRTRPRKQQATCFTCDRPSKVRGLCMACYQLTRRAIDAGMTTDKKLLESGKILPPQKGGRPRKAWAERFCAKG